MPILRSALHLLRRFWAELLAVVALAALIIGVNPERLGKVFSEIQWRIALLMIPVVLAVYVFRGLAWWVALRGIGEHISVRRTMLIELAGQVMIFLPLGDLTRVAMVRSADHEEGVGAITATVVLQELSFMLLMSLGAVPQLVQRPNIALLLIAVILALFGVFALILWKPAYERAIRIVESVKFFRRFDEQLQDIRPAFLLLCRPRILSGVIVLQALAALGSFLLFDLALLAIGINVGYVAAVFVLGVSYTFSAISFLPLGLGAFEGVLTVILITYGIPAAAGAGSALLFRGYNDILMALIGLPCLLYLRQHANGGRRTRST